MQRPRGRVVPPVELATKVLLAFLGAITGGLVALLAWGVTRSEVTGIVVAVVAVIGLAGRGLATRVVLAADHIAVRNLWRTRTIEVSAIERLSFLRHAGTFKTLTPAVSVRGRSLRVPIYAAAIWGTLVRGRDSSTDRRIATALRHWARDVGVRYDKGYDRIVDD